MIHHRQAMVRRDWLLALAAFFMVLASALPSLLATFAPDPLEYGFMPFAVTPNPVQVGAAVEVAVYRCNRDWFAHIDYTVTRELAREDGLVITLPTTTTRLSRGCTQSKPLITIPRSTPPGRYRVQGLAHAQGTLRASDEFYYSDWFTVQEAE